MKIRDLKGGSLSNTELHEIDGVRYVKKKINTCRAHLKSHELFPLTYKSWRAMHLAHTHWAIKTTFVIPSQF